MKTEKRIEDMLRILKKHQRSFGTSPEREIAIKVLEWVLNDEIEEVINA